MIDLIEKSLKSLKRIYGSDKQLLQKQITRYENLVNDFENQFGEKPKSIFSAPGRTEICGNHTDHNNGKVMAASIDLDTIAAVKINDNKIRIRSEGFDPLFEVDLNELKKLPAEEGTTNSLIRGIAAKFKDMDFKIGGFDAYLSSQVGIGSGLSSSASIEVMIGTILNHLYNDGRISPVRIAQIGQFAENEYFGKPCGLMDQLAIAVGGMLEIDFKAQEPKIIETDFNQEKANFDIIIVDTGGNHADLTHNYAAIPEEMKAVASQFDKESCRELDMPVVLANISVLRDKVGDRAILRCLHFLNENRRVDQLAETIARNDYDQFLRIIKKSGNSSFKYLQNCYPEQEPEDQGISLALALTEHFIRKNNCRGACRVHGGGFAGTIQAFIEREYTDEYIGFMENIFGRNSLTKVRIRDAGSMKII